MWLEFWIMNRAETTINVPLFKGNTQNYTSDYESEEKKKGSKRSIYRLFHA